MPSPEETIDDLREEQKEDIEENLPDLHKAFAEGFASQLSKRSAAASETSLKDISKYTDWIYPKVLSYPGRSGVAGLLGGGALGYLLGKLFGLTPERTALLGGVGGGLLGTVGSLGLQAGLRDLAGQKILKEIPVLNEAGVREMIARKHPELTKGWFTD